MTKPSKQVKPQPQPKQEMTRAQALKLVLQALDHAADYGALAEFRPEVRTSIRFAIELLKQPEPQPAEPCEGCEDKKPAKGKGK